MYGYKYTHAYMHVYMCIFEVGPQKKTEFIHKKLCYFYMFKLQSPSKYSPWDAIHLLRLFFSLLKTIFEHVNFDAI